MYEAAVDFVRSPAWSAIVIGVFIASISGGAWLADKIVDGMRERRAQRESDARDVTPR